MELWQKAAVSAVTVFSLAGCATLDSAANNIGKIPGSITKTAMQNDITYNKQTGAPIPATDLKASCSAVDRLETKINTMNEQGKYAFQIARSKLQLSSKLKECATGHANEADKRDAWKCHFNQEVDAVMIDGTQNVPNTAERCLRGGTGTENFYVKKLDALKH